MARSYHEEQNLEYAQRIREICEDMPLWFIDFIRSQADVLTPLTRFITASMPASFSPT